MELNIHYHLYQNFFLKTGILFLVHTYSDNVLNFLRGHFLQISLQLDKLFLLFESRNPPLQLVSQKSNSTSHSPLLSMFGQHNSLLKRPYTPCYLQYTLNLLKIKKKSFQNDFSCCFSNIPFTSPSHKKSQFHNLSKV